MAMKKKLLTMLIISFSFFFELFGQKTKQHPFVLQQVNFRGSVEKIHLTDYNSDQKDEYIMLVDQPGVKSSIRLYDHDLPTLHYQKNFQTEILDFCALDWNDRGFTEILLIEKDSHWINLLLMNIETISDTLAFFSFISLDEFGEDISVKYPKSIDINKDGFKDIIVATNSGKNPKKRAVSAIDLKNKKVLWEFLLAPNIRSLNIKFIDNVPFLIVSTISPNNGYFKNNMSDSFSYALVLDPFTGKCLFQKELGRGSSFTDIIYFNYFSDSGLEFVSASANQNIDVTDPGKIILWDFDSGTMQKIVDNFYTEEIIHVADINNDGKNELVRSGLNDKILIYNENFIPLDTILIPDHQLRIEKITDINRDGFLEYIISADRTSTFILNNRKEIQAKADFYGEVYSIKSGKKNDYLIGILNYEQNLLKVFSFQPNKETASNITFNFVGGIVLGILLTISIFFIYSIIQRKRKLLNSAEIVENLPLATLITDANEKILLCNHEMEKILKISRSRIIDRVFASFFQERNISADLKKNSKTEKWQNQNFNLKFENSKKKSFDGRLQQLWHKKTFLGYLLSVSDRTQALHYRQTIAWAAMAQRLAHEIKNPLTTVKLSLQRLKMEYEEIPDSVKNKYDKYVDSILEEIIRLRKVSENFMKLCRVDLPKFQLINLDEIIRRVLLKFKLVVTENVSIEYNPGINLPEIEADADQIEAIINNIIDNSVKAISQKGSIEIKTQIIEEIRIDKNYRSILIEIEDNGKGIPEKQMDKIFEPYVKGETDGTGLGLAIVKKFIENHNGSINIFSKENTGTSANIQLPIKQKTNYNE